jgi:hypothetical protein
LICKLDGPQRIDHRAGRNETNTRIRYDHLTFKFFLMMIAGDILLKHSTVQGQVLQSSLNGSYHLLDSYLILVGT